MNTKSAPATQKVDTSQTTRRPCACDSDPNPNGCGICGRGLR